MSDEIPIGPNPCQWCGGEYGEHANDCNFNMLPETHGSLTFSAVVGTGSKRQKAVAEEVPMIDVICENQKLKGEVFELKRRIEAGLRLLNSAAIDFMHHNYGLADTHRAQAGWALKGVDPRQAIV